MPINDQLPSFFKGEVFDDEESLKTYSKDASIFEIKPQIALAPKDAEDIKALVKYVNANPQENLSLTPRSAATCMSGGPLTDSIVLDMTKHFNQVLEVGEGFARTQPGVYYRDFEKKTLELNLLLPCYTSSREICTVGGMVGNNSAGELSLSYGQTKDWVKRLKVVLSDGNEYILEPLDKAGLDKKLAQQDFEGEIYRKTFDLVSSNSDLVQAARPKTSKNSAGYLLWDIWDGHTFDLTKLFTGSQGTLGIVTEIEFKLIQPKTHSALLLIYLHDLNALDQIVNKVLEHKPESFECFDDQTIKYALRFLPELTKKFKQNSALSVFLQFIPEYIQYLTQSLPKLVLIANFVGMDNAEAIRKALDTQESLKELTQDTKIRLDQATEKFWITRRESFALLKNHATHMRTAPFIDDIIVDPKNLPTFLPRLKAILDPYKKQLIHTLAGHIGNGNFHIIPLVNLNDPRSKEVIPEVARKVFDLVFEFGGSMAGEHNDGLVRGMYLEKMYGENVYQLFKEIKYIFDPQNIFNPHKKSDATEEYSLDHISGVQIHAHGS
jgi:FAD/FMN-containing dehydrogenase